MANTIKRTVEIEFLSKGIDSISKNLQMMAKFLPESSKDAINVLKNSITKLKSDVASSGTEVSKEIFEVLSKDYKSLINEMGKLRNAMIAPKNPELAKELALLESQTMQLEEQRRIKEEILEDSKGYLKNDQGVFTTATGDTRTKISQKIFATPGEVSKEPFLNIRGESTKNLTSFQNTITKIKETGALIGKDFEHIIKKISEGTTISSDMSQKFTEAWKNSETAISKQINGEQAISQLQNERLLDLKIEEEISAKIKSLNDAKNDIARISIELQDKENRLDEINKKLAEDTTDPELNKVSADILHEQARLKAELAEVTDRYKKSQHDANKVIDDGDKKQKKFNGSIGEAAKNVFNYAIIIQSLKRVYRETIRTITELDKSLTDMAIVTEMNRKEAWALIPTLQDLAKETGFTTTEVSALTTEYLKQGKSLSDALILSEAAAKAAKIAGISASESVQYLTAALNGFSLAADKAMEVSDKFAALAAASATDYEQLAVGLSKFASQANLAGVSIDFALGMLAKGVETTQEAPESIGTALKTVLARMRELTDYGKTLEDGMNVNRVETALEQVGVSLRTANGEFRNMEDVLKEVGAQWNTLNTNQQAAVAVAMAGTRQQSRLIAMFQDFDRTLELVDESEQAAGATQAQHAEYMKSMAAALANLKTSWQQFITTISSSEIIIDIIKGIASVITGLSNAINKAGNTGKTFMSIMAGTIIVLGGYKLAMKSLVIWKGISTALTNAQIAADNKEKIGLVTKIGLHILETKALKSKALAQLAALGLVGLAIAAAAALATGIYFLIKKHNEETKSLREKNEELQVNRYEINQTIKAMDGLIDKYDELNSKVIKTDEDVEALKNLENELKEIKGLNLVYDEITGDFNLEATMQNLKELRRIEDLKIDANYNQQMANIYAERENIIAKYAKDLKFYSNLAEDYRGYMTLPQYQNKGSQSRFAETIARAEANYAELLNKQNKKIEDMFESNKQDIVNYYIHQFDVLNDRNLTDNQKKIMRDYYDKVLSADTFLDESKIKANEQEYLGTMEGIFTSLEEAGKESFKTQLEMYSKFKDQYAGVGSELNSIISEVLSEEYRTLEYYMDIFGDSGAFVDIFAGQTNVTKTINDLGQIANAAGIATDSIIKSVAARKQALEDKGIDPLSAQAMAWSEVAEQTDNAALKAKLYSIASGQTTLNISQQLDAMNSAMKNIVETQEKMMSGELSQSDLYSFLQEHADLFSDQGVMERFLAGEDISLELINEKLELAKGYQSNLIAVNKELAALQLEMAGGGTVTQKAREKALITQRNQLTALMSYRGELNGVTEAQYAYNKTLQSYDNLQKAGINNLELNNQLLKELEIVTTEAITQSQNNISDIESGLQDTFGSSWSSLYKIINGTVVISEEAINSLSEAEMTSLNDYTDALQTQYDKQLESFTNLKDKQIAIEKEKAEKQKQIYEDYFDKLDRLENMRERKQDRESITKQLQRLEGATDERSRQKAKELRAELIQMDQEAAKEDREQAREDLLNSYDNKMDELEEKWSQAGLDFIEAMSAGGTKAADAMIAVLQANGLISEAANGAGAGTDAFSPTTGSSTITSGSTTSLDNGTDDTFIEPIVVDPEKKYKDAFKALVKWEWDNDRNTAPTSYASFKKAYDKYAAKRGWDFSTLAGIKAIHDSGKVPLNDFHMPNNKGNQLFDNWWYTNAKSFFKIDAYKKGGIVDYTGPAMVHGTLSNPEAFLNADQTALFANLRDVLASMKIGSGASTGITIENITIQTAQLNNNQDFKSAGNALAEAFSSAINRRGLNLNTKR